MLGQASSGGTLEFLVGFLFHFYEKKLYRFFFIVFQMIVDKVIYLLFPTYFDSIVCIRIYVNEY